MLTVDHPPTDMSHGFPNPGRAIAALTLSLLLAVGAVVLTPSTAHAATEVRVALPSGAGLDFTGNGTYAVFGSTIVAGDRMSTDAGATWTYITPIHTTQPVTNQWVVEADGTLVRLGYVNGGSFLFDVWSLSTGNISTYYTADPEIVSYNASMYLTHSNARYNPTG